MKNSRPYQWLTTVGRKMVNYTWNSDAIVALHVTKTKTKIAEKSTNVNVLKDALPVSWCQMRVEIFLQWFDTNIWGGN